jgi:hypothetical protein
VRRAVVGAIGGRAEGVGAEILVAASDQRCRNHEAPAPQAEPWPASSFTVACLVAYLTTARILSWLAPLARSTATKDKRGAGRRASRLVAVFAGRVVKPLLVLWGCRTRRWCLISLFRLRVRTR